MVKAQIASGICLLKTSSSNDTEFKIITWRYIPNYVDIFS